MKDFAELLVGYLRFSYFYLINWQLNVNDVVKVWGGGTECSKSVVLEILKCVGKRIGIFLFLKSVYALEAPDVHVELPQLLHSGP